MENEVVLIFCLCDECIKLSGIKGLPLSKMTHAEVIQQKEISQIITAELPASVNQNFFLISNFGVWIGGMMYPVSLGGLISCYIAGLPFFGWTLVGNAFYCTMLFGGFEFAINKISVLQAR